MSFAYAFCQYDDIFIDQNSELVSYSDAIKKCGTRGELAESRGLAWPHELRLRMGILWVGLNNNAWTLIETSPRTFPATLSH